MGARVGARQGHPLVYEPGAKVKSYDIMKSAERSSTANRAGCPPHWGWSQKSRFAEEESRRHRGVRCAQLVDL